MHPKNGLHFEAELDACALLAQQGRHSEGLLCARTLLDQAEPGSMLWCNVSRWLCLHAVRLGELELCLQVGEAALAKLDASAQAALIAHILSILVLACEQSGRFPDALRYADQCVRMARRADDPSLLSWALNRLGSVHCDLGDEEVGLSLLREAERLARQAGDLSAEFAALNNQGSQLNWRSLGQLKQQCALSPELALQSLRQALSVVERTGNQSSMAICLTNLAWALRETGALSESAQAATRAMALADTLGLVQVRMHSRIEAALTRLAQGDADQAARWLEEAAPLHNAADRWGALALQRALSAAHRAQGRFEAALQVFECYHALAMDEARIRSHLHLEALRREHELEMSEQRTRRAALEAEMQRLRADQLRQRAHEDALTGLYNRHFVDEQLPLLRKRACERAKPLMALLCDADHFKAVNDSFGHRVGDQVLRQMGLLLMHHTRVSDLAARWGGEELLLLMPDTEPQVALEVAERLRRAVEGQPWHELAKGLSVTLSIGVAAVPPQGELDTVLSSADAALYRAKRDGRNCVRLDQAQAAEGLK